MSKDLHHLPIDSVYQYGKEYCSWHCICTTPVYDDDGKEISRWIYRKDDDNIETKVRVVHTGSNKVGLFKILKTGRH